MDVRQERRAVSAFAVVVVTAALLTYAVSLARRPATANPDVAWTVHVAQRLLAGEQFGREVTDNNPPLIYWGSMPVVAVARGLGIPPLPFYGASVVLLFLGCAWICRRMLAQLLVAGVRDSLALLVLAIPVLIAGYGHAQRDAMIGALLLPYLVGAGLAARGETAPMPLRLASGLLAGVAFSLKPHHLVVWLAIELLVMARRRNLSAWSRPENYVIAASGMCYLASVPLFAPGYFESMRDAAAVYSAYDNSVPWLSEKSYSVVFALLVVLAVRPRSILGSIAWCSMAASVAQLAAVHLQGKDYEYHYFPAQVTAAFVVALCAAHLVVDAAERGVPGIRKASRRLPLLLAGGIVAALPLVWLLGFSADERDNLAAFIAERGASRPIVFFSSSVDPPFPSILFTDSRSVSPYSAFWPLPGNYSREEMAEVPFPYHSPDSMGEIERRFVTRIIDVIEQEKPGLLFFPKSPWKQAFQASDFDFEEYFRQDPRFERLMAEYAPVGSIDLTDGPADAWRRTGTPRR